MSTDSFDQQRTSAGRVTRIQSAFHHDPPAADTEPDVVTSPVRADGLLPTTGIMVCLKLPTLAPAAAPATTDGFDVTIWIRNPATLQWGDTVTFQTPGDQWLRTFDFNGGDLYFQIDQATIDTDGAMDWQVVEL
jgi:hypothetical protein